jgi:hypothetical protein
MLVSYLYRHFQIEEIPNKCAGNPDNLNSVDGNIIYILCAQFTEKNNKCKSSHMHITFLYLREKEAIFKKKN